MKISKRTNQICCSELKTQNAFVPIIEDGIWYKGDGDQAAWRTEPVPSLAICQLEDVEAILGGDQDNTEYVVEIKGSNNGIKCKVSLTPSADAVNRTVRVVGDGEAHLRKDGGIGSHICQPGNVNVTYKYNNNADNTGGVLTMMVPLDAGEPSATCKFIQNKTGEGQPTIDEQFLTLKKIRLSIEGTHVSERKKKYVIMKDEFVCAVQGTMFKSAIISCGSNDETNEAINTLQTTCGDLTSAGERLTASCLFKFEDTTTLLQQITFNVQRSNIEFYNCKPGSELDKKEGVCALCKPGTYKDKESGNCEPCKDLGQYAPNPGSISCYECKTKNGYVNQENTTCTFCPPGQTVQDGKCQNCSAGHYQIGTECEPCDDSFKYSIEGATGCYHCYDGYQINGAKNGCSPCPPGTFNNNSTQKNCSACPKDWTTSGYGKKTCDVKLDTIMYCEQIKESSSVGEMNFYPVQAGQQSRAPCPINKESSAVRQCNAQAEWEEPDITECDSINTGKIKKITVESEDSVNDLKEKTKDTNAIAPKDIEIVVSKMKGDEMKHVFNSSTTTSIKGLAENSMAVMSNMMVASRSSPTNQKTKNQIVDSIEHVALLALEHLKNDDETVDFSTEASDVILVKEAASSLSPIGNENIKINLNGSSNIQNLAALIYKDNKAFKPPSNKSRGTSFIAGKVVGLKHTKREGDTTDDSISFKMKFDFPDLNNPDKKPRQKVLKECHFYQPESDSWSTAGCTSTVAEDGSVECECNHMTSFAVILSVEENKVPMWLSNLVLGINVTFCILTLLCTLPFRTFRVRKMTIIQSHSILSLCLLCITWFLMQDLELSESEPAYENTSCKAIAFIAHYFLIATFSWIFCCSLTLKSQIVDAVKSFGKKNKYLVKKCVLFGYGFPLLIPSLAFLMDFLMKKYTTEGQEIHYIQKMACWYEDIWIYSFILFPIYVFFIINIVCFIKIMRVIGNARRSSDGSSQRKVVKAGFALAFTQGLPWVMHPGALTDGAAEVFQYLFLITFGLQGIGLFVFNVLFQEEVLKNLCGLLNVKPPPIFLSVVPSKQRRTPNSQTGETSLGTARNSSGNADKLYSNNFTLTSVAATAVEKSIYQDSSYYNELHESSVVTEHKSDDTYSQLDRTRGTTRELGGSNTDLLEKPLPSPRGVVNFVAGIRTYNNFAGHRSPIPGETEKPDHQGPPFV
ncbi:hypothetical protein ACHWQZ_G000160 [Mnemiopsis leidyi]